SSRIPSTPDSTTSRNRRSSPRWTASGTQRSTRSLVAGRASFVLFCVEKCDLAGEQRELTLQCNVASVLGVHDGEEDEYEAVQHEIRTSTDTDQLSKPCDP